MTIRVSDHAVLRWLERVAGVDVEAIRNHLNVPMLERAADFGAHTVRLADGVRIKLDGHVVTTCTGKRPKAKCRSGRPRA